MLQEPINSDFAVVTVLSHVQQTIRYCRLDSLEVGDSMSALSSLGIFLDGLGILLLSFGIFWFVSVY